MASLPAGLIFNIAADAELAVSGKGAKRTLKCPFHEDRSASAFLSATNCFGCSVCYPGTAIPAKEFCAKLGRDWKSYTGNLVRDTPAATPAPTEVPFTAADAEVVWQAARARFHDDSCAEADRPVYEYLDGRGLGEAWDMRQYGVLGPNMTLPPRVAAWPSRGYCIVVPLYDVKGEIACVQARNIRGNEPKTLVPKCSHISGTVFANEAGRALLRGEPCDHKTVILAEGLTDFLALSIATLIPVLAAPGTSTAVKAVGPWVYGRDLVIALDFDDAGKKATPAVAVAAFDLGARKTRAVVWPKCAIDACDVVAERGVEGLAVFIRAQLAGGSK